VEHGPDGLFVPGSVFKKLKYLQNLINGRGNVRKIPVDNFSDQRCLTAGG
jgi:hypothetical protein